MFEKWYSLKEILKRNAQYNIIIGERSNGKTYACLKYALERYFKHGEQFAVLRRWRDDFTGKRGQTMFDALVNNGEIVKMSSGAWTGIYYYASKWYLCRYDETGKRISSENPVAYGFSISSMEHDKGTSYPNIHTIIFDEFLSRQMYLQDEFILFMNCISTIKRKRNDVKIFMLGNTVNKYCPYFSEMGLKHIKNQKQGTIDLYSYGKSDLKVAVEYCKPSGAGKENDSYFAFDNPKLQMITGGQWELDIYPHLPVKYKPKDILFTYFIIFDNELLQCEIVGIDNQIFTYIHRKTTPLQDDKRDLIFTQEYSALPNFRRKINKPTDKITKKISDMFFSEKVFYQDNDVGEVIRNYVMWCCK